MGVFINLTLVITWIVLMATTGDTHTTSMP